MPIIRVGLGHTSPPADYVSAQLAWDTLSGTDQGSDVVMLGSGDCGTAFNPTGTPVNNWSLRTEGIDYNGDPTVRAQLAYITRMVLNVNLDISHFRITSNNAFFSSWTMGAGSDGSTFTNLYCEHPNASGVDVISLTGSCPNTTFEMNELIGGMNGIDYGFNFVLNVNRVTQLSAINDGFEGSGNNGLITNTFALLNGVNDFISVTTSTCASEDLTGDFTGYTSAEFVDFASEDYRIRSNSFLATAGSGGGLIGAFLQAGGAGDNDSVISAAMPSMISSALLSSVVPSNSVSTSSVMPSMVSSFLASQSEPVYDSQIISVMPSMSSSLLASQSVPVYSLQSSSDMPSMSSMLVASNLAAGFNAQVSSDMPSMVSALDSDHDLPEFSVSASSLMPSMTASISLSQIVSGNAANIDSIMPSMGSSAAISNVNPQLSAQILSDMPSMNSAVGLSRIVPGNELSVSSLMPSMQSSLLLGVSEPVDLTLSVLSAMPSMQSALTLINGDIQRIDNIALSFAVDGISVEYKQLNMNISYGE